MKEQKLMLAQLDRKLQLYKQVESISPPVRGWINVIRTSLTMSLRQLGERMKMSAQGVRDIEEREQSGAITLRALRQVGEALDLKLVYGFVPQQGSLEQMIEDRARELAREIVTRTSVTMDLEAQRNTDERLENAVQEKTAEFKRSLPRYLWD